MLVKVAYYASSIANYAPFLIMLFEKKSKEVQKYVFSLEAVGLQERNATNPR